jgi:hypothetical protein
MTAPAAYASPGTFSVLITAHTDFSQAVSSFDSNLPGCSTGTVVNGSGGAHFTPWGGNFVGTKQFTCDGGAAGFDVRVQARFGGGGSVGSWVIAGAWGDLAGMKGSGRLVGIPSDIGIDDNYAGTVR